MTSGVSARVVGESLLQADDLRIEKGGGTILSDVTFTIESGTFAALAGPSGSGKTSLLRVLALLDTPAAGAVKLWQREYSPETVSQPSAAAAVYPRLNYVPQTLGLWPHLTIRQNLTFSLSNHLRSPTWLDELCAELDIGRILDRFPANASQGQRQRAALARALLLEPQILLLDEVTAALDRPLATTVWRLLHDFVEGGGVVLASTHDAYLAERCNRLYRISDCRLVMERTQ
jgi:ABC-type lipoprotein export system ATPase subunit